MLGWQGFLGSPCRDAVHVGLQLRQRDGFLKGVPMAAKGSLVGFAVDAITSYRLRTVTGGTSLGHVLDWLGESVHGCRQRQGRNTLGAIPLEDYLMGSVLRQTIAFE
jgi:hypothetical protein